MWVRRGVAVSIGFATLLAPVTSWATSATSTSTPVYTPEAAPSLAALPLRRDVDTTGVRRRERPGSCGDAANGTHLAIHPAFDGTVRAQTSGSDAAFDPVLILRDDRGRVVACNDDASPATVESTLSALVRRGQRYVLEVAGQGGSTGRTQLHADLSRPHVAHPMTGTGSIGGVVTSRYDGRRISGVCVVAFDQFGDAIRSAVTVVGTYRLESLPPTQLRIGFLTCPGHQSAYQQRYWNNKPSLDKADPIALRDGQQVRHVDAQLAPWGNITGTVYDAAGTHPLAGICVQADSAILQSVLHAVTSVTGTYRIQVLSPITGSYRIDNAAADWYTISFHDCGSGIDSDAWWDGTPGGTENPHGARPLHLDVGQALTNINADMHQGGSVTGAVRDLATGLGVAGACVRATAPNRPTRFAQADVSGRYRLAPLAPGAYTVFFSDCARGRLSSLFWRNTHDPGLAEPVQVVAGQSVAGVNANLPKRGSMAGTVVDAQTGALLEGMCVTVRGNDPNAIQASTDFLGRFVIPNLSVGPYIVSIRDCGYFSRKVAYLDTYYQHTLDAAQAKPVIVLAQIRTKIVAKMLRSGGIAGVVRQKFSQKPIVGTCVEILDAHSGSTAAEMQTSVTGAYRLAVAPGSYDVRFSSCAGGFFLTQYYNGSPDRRHATKITVGPSHDVTGIDGALGRGGAITGQILDRYGNYPYFGVCAQARVGKSPGRVVAEAVSDYEGRYEIGGLPTGHYHVEFGHCHGQVDYFAPTFYYHSPTYDGSTAVAVGTNQLVTGIDGVLDYGGSISGTVRDAATGAPVNGVCVEAVSNDPDQIPQFSTTYYDGSFYIYNLAPGQYHLRFGHDAFVSRFYQCEETDVAVSWYPKAIDEASSKAVTLQFDQFLYGVDGFVFKPAQVTGYVTSATTGVPLAAPCAQAYGSSGEARGRAATIAAGIYAVFDLPPDTYRVRIASCGTKPYMPQFFDGAPDIDHATPIPLAVGQVRSDIDAALQPRAP
jgi:hypothetical protein